MPSLTSRKVGLRWVHCSRPRDVDETFAVVSRKSLGSGWEKVTYNRYRDGAYVQCLRGPRGEKWNRLCMRPVLVERKDSNGEE